MSVFRGPHREATSKLSTSKNGTKRIETTLLRRCSTTGTKTVTRRSTGESSWKDCASRETNITKSLTNMSMANSVIVIRKSLCLKS